MSQNISGGGAGPGAGPVRITTPAPTFGLPTSGTPSLSMFSPAIPWANPSSVPAAPTPISNVTMAETRFPGAGAVTGNLATEMATPTLDGAVHTLNSIPSNWFISKTRNTIPFKDRAFQMPYEGQLVFAVTDRDASINSLSGDHAATAARRAHSHLPLRGVTGAGDKVGIFNLAQWNWLSASSEKKVGPYELRMSAEARWANWTVEGVVRTEEGKYNRFGQEEDPRAQKTVSMTKAGQSFCHNYWKRNDLKSSDLLWVILKREPRSTLPKTMGLDGKGTGRKQTTPIPIGLTDHPFQLVPFADPDRDGPSMDDLHYVDDYGRDGWGKAIYIGRVDDPSGMSNEDYLRQASTDTASSLMTDKIWIFLDPSA